MKLVKLAHRVLLVMLSSIAGWAIGLILGLFVTLAVLAGAWEQPLDPWVKTVRDALVTIGAISGVLIGLRLTRHL